MARGDQLARQWMIIQTLISSRAGKSVSDLATKLGFHWRTVYRDLEALQAAGFPLYTRKMDGKNVWLLLDSAKHQIPIPFSLTELMALYFSRDMLKVLKNTIFFDALESLFQKIKTTLPQEYLNYLDLVSQSLQVGSKPYKEYGDVKETIHTINDAIINNRYLTLAYYTMSRKQKTRRQVAPYKIWYLDGTFYLIGHCRLRDDIRIFALDRIKELNPTEETFEIPDDFNLDDVMKASFGVFIGEPVTVRVRFAADSAGYIQEKIWHDSQVIYRQENGSIIFEAKVAGTTEIKFWIMQWGAQATVLAPESLKEEIRTEAQTMLETYENN